MTLLARWQFEARTPSDNYTLGATEQLTRHLMDW